MLFKKSSSIPTPIHEITTSYGLSSTAKVCEACYKVGEIEYREYLHFTSQGIIEHIQVFDDSYSRREIKQADALVECVAFTARLSWVDSSIGDIPALTFSKQKFNELVDRYYELGSDEMVDILLRSCQDEASVIALVRSIKNKESSGIIYLYTEKEDVLLQQEVSFICGSKMNWILRSSTLEEDDWLIASPMSRLKFEEMLLLWCTS